ncbi:unnamed protein product, partial [Ectocarpus sp. 4 AP-2014]
ERLPGHATRLGVRELHGAGRGAGAHLVLGGVLRAGDLDRSWRPEHRHPPPPRHYTARGGGVRERAAVHERLLDVHHVRPGGPQPGHRRSRARVGARVLSVSARRGEEKTCPF